MRIVYQEFALNWLAGRSCLVKNDDAGFTYKGERILQGTHSMARCEHTFTPPIIYATRVVILPRRMEKGSQTRRRTTLGLFDACLACRNEDGGGHECCCARLLVRCLQSTGLS